MDTIELSSSILIITKVLKKTSAKVFKEFKEGTIFYITTKIKKHERSLAGRLYATYCTVNVFDDKDQCFNLSTTEAQNILILRLQCFEYKPYYPVPKFINV